MSKPIALYALNSQINIQECCQNANYWGANTLILSPELYDEPELSALLKRYNLNLWLNLPVYHQPNYLNTHPDKTAVTQIGNLAENEWCRFVCPSDDNFIEYFKQQVEEYLAHLKPAYISLDFIRQYVHWHGQSYDQLTRDDIEYGCFCSRCIQAFNHSDLVTCAAIEEIENRQYSAAYAKWRSQLISQTVTELSQYIKSRVPESQLILNTLPWDQGFLNNALEQLAGINLTKVSTDLDAISPIAFAHLLPSSIDDIKNIMQAFKDQNSVPVYQGLQVAHWRMKKAVPVQQFEAELKQILSAQESGMVIYDYQELKNDEKKSAVLKRHLNPEINF